MIHRALMGSLRALHRHPHRALRRRVPALARAGPGGRAAAGRPARRLRARGRRGAGRGRPARRRRRPHGVRRPQDPRGRAAQGAVHARGRRPRGRAARGLRCAATARATRAPWRSTRSSSGSSPKWPPVRAGSARTSRSSARRSCRALSAPPQRGHAPSRPRALTNVARVDAAEPRGRPHRAAQLAPQAVELGIAQVARRARGGEPRLPERLVGEQVADAGQRALVEQPRLQRRRARADAAAGTPGARSARRPARRG